MNPKLNKAILIALPFALMLWLLGYMIWVYKWIGG